MDTVSSSTPQKASSRSKYDPSTPLSSRTPFTGHYSSPGGSLHQSEDPIVLEIGSRALRAGFANEPVPRCELLYGEEMWRRVGDKVEIDKRGGTMLPQKSGTFIDSKPKKKKGGGEIWTFNLQGRDVGVVEDLVERAIREAYNKYLLVDAKSKRVVIPLPPLIPIPLLTSLTTTIFTHIQPSTITYFSAPVLSTVAAGLRSALIVDIGWHETSVTPVYELRVVGGLVGICGRTKRAGKLLRRKTGEVLENLLTEKGIEGQKIRPEMLDEVISRVVWCDSMDKTKYSEQAQYTTVLIPLETTSSYKPISINVPFLALSKPLELAFFEPISSPGEEGTPELSDEDDHPLPTLLYNTLKACPIDVRATCMARIVIVGKAANIPGLKTRIISELVALIEERGGWNHIRLKNQGRKSNRPSTASSAPATPEPIPSPPTEQEYYSEQERPDTDDDYDPQTPNSSSSQPIPPINPTTRERTYLGKFKEKEYIPSVPPGTVRGVKSLGAWAGASLLAGARVKGIVEVEREKFLTVVGQGGSGFPAGMAL